MSILEIIQQIVQANPEASKTQVSEALVDYIEAELPNIVRAMKILKTPSPARLREMKLKLRRTRKKAKTAFKDLTRETEQFAREMAFLRQMLDGGPSSNFMDGVLQDGQSSSLAPTMSSRDSLFPLLPIVDGTPAPDILPEPSKLPRRIRSFSPYIVGVEEPEEHLVIRFMLDRNVESKIGSDLMFEEFLRVVEVAVRRFAQASSHTWDFRMSVTTDVEAPKWERVVLRIKPLDVDFEKSMELWDQIDAEVRKTVESAVRMHPTESERITELNRNFFIEMDLD